MKELVFEEIKGWTVFTLYQHENNLEGTVLDLSNPAKNVSYFVEEKVFDLWYRNEVTE